MKLSGSPFVRYTGLSGAVVSPPPPVSAMHRAFASNGLINVPVYAIIIRTSSVDTDVEYRFGIFERKFIDSNSVRNTSKSG